MTEPKEALKPCPFCGGDAEYERKGDRRQSTIVSCLDCGATLESGDEWSHWRSWNTRADATENAALREKLAVAREALEKVCAVRVCREGDNIWAGSDRCKKIARQALKELDND